MKTAFLFFILGLSSGAILGLCNFISLIFKNNIVARFVSDLIFSLSAGCLFIFSINKHFFGVIRLYIVVIFALGLYIERKTLGKLFAKLYFILYNVGRKWFLKFSSTRLGKIIFK